MQELVLGVLEHGSVQHQSFTVQLEHDALHRLSFSLQLELSGLQHHRSLCWVYWSMVACSIRALLFNWSIMPCIVRVPEIWVAKAGTFSWCNLSVGKYWAVIALCLLKPIPATR
eukprot:jgi/Chrzof1/6301/Cz18g00220.t1